MPAARFQLDHGYLPVVYRLQYYSPYRHSGRASTSSCAFDAPKTQHDRYLVMFISCWGSGWRSKRRDARRRFLTISAAGRTMLATLCCSIRQAPLAQLCNTTRLPCTAGPASLSHGAWLETSMGDSFVILVMRASAHTLPASVLKRTFASLTARRNVAVMVVAAQAGLLIVGFDWSASHCLKKRTHVCLKGFESWLLCLLRHLCLLTWDRYPMYADT